MGLAERCVDLAGGRTRRWAAAVGLLLSGLLGPSASAQSVDPEAWARTDLLVVEGDTYVYDHFTECAMRDEGARAEERILAHIRATAPRDAMSRDQLVALIQRMEAVFLFGIGQGFRPEATALAMASILDCRPRPGSKAPPQHELILEIGHTGFRSTFLDHVKGTKLHHGETWVEAFRP